MYSIRHFRLCGKLVGRSIIYDCNKHKIIKDGKPVTSFYHLKKSVSVTTQSDLWCRFYSAEKPNAVSKLESGNLNPEYVQTSNVPEQEDEEEEEYDDDYDLSLTDDQMQELTKGDPELIKKVKYIQLEHAVMKQEGHQVSSRIKMSQWKELLNLDSRSKRRKYHLYLFKNEMKTLSDKRKKENKREERLKDFAANPLPTREEDIFGMCYGLTRNTLFLRLYDTTVGRLFQGRACSAILHNPPLIFDCGYDEYMTAREAKNCAKQLELVITGNRAHREPFNLYLCNAQKSSKTIDFLHRLIPTMYNDDFILNLYENSFLNIFPKEKLVYLTPHTRDELEEYNEDDIYIVGAIVDKSDARPYSLATAKRLGLRMKKLPLDTHLMWGLGGKCLTLNQLMNIMLDIRYTRGDWKTALKHVPMRKLNREFHPYPDQVGNQYDGHNNDSSPQQYRRYNQSQGNYDDTSPIQQSRRYENQSQVLKDFELLNRRKGFRRSDMYVPKSRNNGSAPNRPNMRSLLYDDE